VIHWIELLRRIIENQDFTVFLDAVLIVNLHSFPQFMKVSVQTASYNCNSNPCKFIVQIFPLIQVYYNLCS